MVDTDYKTLKTRIEDLINNIDKIDQEAASFSAAKAELVMIAGNLHTISSDLSAAIKASDAILSQVETVAVSNTLEVMRNSVARFDETSKQLITVCEQSMKESAARFDETSKQLIAVCEQSMKESAASFDETSKQLITVCEQSMKESATRFGETSKQLITVCEQLMNNTAEKYVEISTDLLSKVGVANEEHLQMLQQKVDSLAKDFNIKIFIMGGVAIISSIAALVFALV